MVDKRDNLQVPTAFSPNGDGKNDVFKVSNLTFQRIMEFRVFNRWGQEIFNSNTNAGWDGKLNGTPLPVGVFVWVCHYQFPNEMKQHQTGTVTLIR